MDPYFNLEPTPGSYRLLSRAPRGQPLRFFSWVRLRDDLPDGVADQMAAQWYEALSHIREQTGGEMTLNAQALYVSPGSPIWDRVVCTSFPDKDAAISYANHPGWFDVYKLRRSIIADAPTLLTHPTGFTGQSPASADDYGPSASVRFEMDDVAASYASALALYPGQPFVLATVLRQRQDRSPGLVRAAYAGWRVVLNAVMADLGLEDVLNDSVLGTFIGPEHPGHFLNAIRYQNPAMLAALFADPRIQSAVAMRRAAVEDLSVVLLHELAD
jgi:hypothetical protein